MAYVINKTDGTLVATIQDGTYNQTLDVSLVGKNYAGYGTLQNENFVYLLENFANSSEPRAAIRGQLWFDTVNGNIKVNTGNISGGSKIWKTLASVNYNSSSPTLPVNGDMWFDTGSHQLKIYVDQSISSNRWLAVGQPPVVGTGTTQMVSKQIRGFAVLGGNEDYYSVIIATINDVAKYIISSHDFYVNQAYQDSPAGFYHVSTGITFPNTGTDISQLQGDILWGKSADSDRLGTHLASDYIRRNQVDPIAIDPIVEFSNDGLKVGAATTLSINSDGSLNPNIISTGTSYKSINISLSDGILVKTPVIIGHADISPWVTGQVSLGTSMKQWDAVYAADFVGTATNSDNMLSVLDSGSGYVAASVLATTDTVATRDNNAALTATTFNSPKTGLIEIFTTDEASPLDTGTVVVVGDTANVKTGVSNVRAIGVVAGDLNSAFISNSDEPGDHYAKVVIKGSVVVNTSGSISKGDRLVAGDSGTAKAWASSADDPYVFAVVLTVGSGNTATCMVL